MSVPRGRASEERRRTNVPRGRASEERRRTNVPRGRASEERRRTNVPRGRTNEGRQRTNVPRGRASEERRRTNVPRGRASEERRRTNVPRGRASEERRRTNVPRGRTNEGRQRASGPRGRRSFASFRHRLRPPRTSPASASAKKAHAIVTQQHAVAIRAPEIATDRTARTSTARAGVSPDRARGSRTSWEFPARGILALAAPPPQPRLGAAGTNDLAPALVWGFGGRMVCGR